MFYSDHEFESDTKPGSNEGRCAAILVRRDGSEYKCNGEWYSAVHPPDQFRHWCSALENGYDCMHFEE